MNSKSIFFIFVFLIPSLSFADLIGGNLYIKGEVLATKYESTSSLGLKYKSEPSYGFGGGIGITFPMGFRSEIVLNHMFETKFKNGLYGRQEVNAFADAIMLRGLYDIVDLKLIKAYVGAGLGYSRIRHELEANRIIKATYSKGSDLSSKHKYNMAYNLIAGITAEVAPSFSLDLGYLYANYGKSRGYKEFDKGGEISLKSHNILLGIRYEL